MSSGSAPAVQEPDLATAPPSLVALFLAFARMSLAGFGGVLVFARRAIVEQHRWMTADEFNETFALCHFLPGPNIVNLSMVFGSRLRGIAGGIHQRSLGDLEAPKMRTVAIAKRGPLHVARLAE